MFKKTTLSLGLALATALCCAAQALAAHPFLMLNAGRHVVEHIQISGVNRSMWGPDLLGRYVLNPGGRVNFRIGEGCAEDVRVIYRNGYTIVRRSVNTCALSGLRLLY